MNFEKIFKWINYNRFIVLGPVLAIVIWIVAIGCTPTAPSPLDPGRLVDVVELELDFKTWQGQTDLTAIKFEAAGKDLERQQQGQEKIKEFIIKLASGGVADLPGLGTLLVGSGALGAITDNIRKRGLIAGLKKKNE